MAVFKFLGTVMICVNRFSVNGCNWKLLIIIYTFYYLGSGILISAYYLILGIPEGDSHSRIYKTFFCRALASRKLTKLFLNKYLPSFLQRSMVVTRSLDNFETSVGLAQYTSRQILKLTRE